MENDSPQNLVEVRRSSGEKEWMTREKLAALHKQHALKREQSNKSIKHDWSGMKVSLCFNALLLIPFEAVITNFLVGLTL